MPKLRDTPKTRMDRGLHGRPAVWAGHARGDRQGHHAADAQIYRHLLQALAQSGWLYPGGAAHPHPPVLQRPPALRCLRCRVPRGHAGAERGLRPMPKTRNERRLRRKSTIEGCIFLVILFVGSLGRPGSGWRRFCDPVKFAIACGFAPKKKRPPVLQHQAAQREKKS